MKILAAAAAAALAFAAVPASATVILFSDFDAVSSPLLSSQGYANFAVADGWTAGAFGIEIQANNVAGAPFSSPNLVELDTTVNSSMFVTLGAGTYSVSYYYSPRPGVDASSNGIALSIGSTTLDSVTGNGAGGTAWQLRTVNFTTTGGNLTFSALGNSDGVGGYLDNITVAAVPEASTWAMLVAGFALVGFASRRRRTSVAA